MASELVIDTTGKFAVHSSPSLTSASQFCTPVAEAPPALWPWPWPLTSVLERLRWGCWKAASLKTSYSGRGTMFSFAASEEHR
jgi:hypothetical protein